MKTPGLIKRLWRDAGGVAMTEFALAAPFMLGFGLWGIETANLALTNMQVSQLAMHIADNASRVGDTSTLEDRKIYEEDINDFLLGSNIQGGSRLDFFAHGRAIVSSLEIYNESTHGGTERPDGTQYIHWQRCKGKLRVESSFGMEGDTRPSGMGRVGHEVVAQDDTPVMFVELVYDYQPLISTAFAANTEVRATSAFVVRDSRDQSQIYEREASVQHATCSKYDDYAK